MGGPSAGGGGSGGGGGVAFWTRVVCLKVWRGCEHYQASPTFRVCAALLLQGNEEVRAGCLAKAEDLPVGEMS